MIVLSFNIRGVGGTPKLLDLPWLFEVVHLDVVFVLETMVSGEKA